MIMVKRRQHSLCIANISEMGHLPFTGDEARSICTQRCGMMHEGWLAWLTSQPASYSPIHSFKLTQPRNNRERSDRKNIACQCPRYSCQNPDAHKTAPMCLLHNPKCVRQYHARSRNNPKKSKLAIQAINIHVLYNSSRQRNRFFPRKTIKQ